MFRWSCRLVTRFFKVAPRKLVWSLEFGVRCLLATCFQKGNGRQVDASGLGCQSANVRWYRIFVSSLYTILYRINKLLKLRYKGMRELREPHYFKIRNTILVLEVSN